MAQTYGSPTWESNAHSIIERELLPIVQEYIVYRDCNHDKKNAERLLKELTDTMIDYINKGLISAKQLRRAKFYNKYIGVLPIEQNYIVVLPKAAFQEVDAAQTMYRNKRLQGSLSNKRRRSLDLNSGRPPKKQGRQDPGQNNSGRQFRQGSSSQVAYPTATPTTRRPRPRRKFGENKL